MKSVSTLVNLATNLSQNNSGANQSLALTIMNDQHRYLIQKYFDNERSVQTTTVGSMTLTLTAAPVSGATSATLLSTWQYPTNTQLVTFSDGEQRSALFTYNSATITWSVPLVPAAGVVFTTTLLTVGYQYYSIPANISKITDNTISVGQLKYTVIPIQTRQEWDRVNFIPYNSDIPQYAFIYNGTVGIFPIPSTTGNILSFNYKGRIPDFSTAFLFSDTSGTAYVNGQQVFDYQAGSLSGITAGSTSITGSSTSWNTTGKFPLNVDVSQFNLYLQIAPPSGDGLWYPISQFNSDTSLTLALPIVSAPSSSTAAHGYSIAQMPVLFEDFHDMLPYGFCMTYFNSIVKDANAYKLYKDMYDIRLALLEDYNGTKQVNVDLGGTPNLTNPNLYIYASH